MSGYEGSTSRKGGFNLDNYVEVSERIEAFRAKHPEGSYQTDIVELPAAFADKFIAVQAAVYRTPDDPSPGIDMAWEPVPGKTPYTKDSELQNACTSAIGRAIVAALAADTRRGIASREEVQARQAKPKARQNPTTSPTIAQDAPNGDESIDLEAKQWEAKQKLRLLEGLDGDKAKAKAQWERIVNVYGTDRMAVEDEVGMVLVANLPPGQEPFL